MTALSGREYESVFRKYIFLIQVFVLENAEGNFLHDSASRVLRFQLREWALLRIWSWHFNNSVQMTGLVCRHAVWLNVFLYSLYKMFSFQSNWKLSASILPWDERQIKLPLALVLLQTKKRQACEESDGYLFSDFESREVSHPFVSKKNTVGFLFSVWMSTYNLLMLQSLWTRTVSSGFLNPAEIYGPLSVRKEKFHKQSCPPGIKNIVKAFELN